MKYLPFGILVLAASLGGCVTSGTPATGYNESSQPADPSNDQVDLVPPVPSFTNAIDCEQAYGAGACGTGAELYQRAGFSVPADAYGFFVPYAFGVMTGVLLNHYFAPPGVYVASFPYHTFTSTTVINTYKTVNQTTVNNYNRASPNIRAQAMRSGPVRYSRSSGMVTGRARFATSAPRSATGEPGASHAKVLSPPAPRAQSAAASYSTRNARTSSSQTPRQSAPNANSTPARSTPASIPAVHTQPAAHPAPSYAAPAVHVKTCNPVTKVCF